MANGDYIEFTMLDIVLQFDPDRDEPEVVYEFSNGRKFLSSDEDGGPYEVP